MNHPATAASCAVLGLESIITAHGVPGERIAIVGSSEFGQDNLELEPTWVALDTPTEG